MNQNEIFEEVKKLEDKDKRFLFLRIRNLLTEINKPFYAELETMDFVTLSKYIREHRLSGNKLDKALLILEKKR